MNCTICNSDKTCWFTPEIRKCDSCGSLFRIRLINYKQEYIDKNYWFDISKPEWAWVPIEQENQANFIRRDVRTGHGSNLVEFGAANGYIAQTIGSYVDNILIQELVDIRTDEVKSNNRIYFRLGTFEEVVKTLDDFSISNVVMNNVIEHINDANNTFEQVNRILRLGGKFIIFTDDGDNPFGSLMAMLGHSEHCFCITKKGIESLCSKYGFNVLKYWRMTDYLSYIVLEKING